MNDLMFRFVLANTTLGSQPIGEPLGWDAAKLKLERDKEFHCIIEFYDQPVTFYKETDGVDGGYDYIKSAIDTLGPDGDVQFLVYISEDGGDTYETLFDGLVALDTYTNIDGYKIECAILRNDLWSIFQNRRDHSVSLFSADDLSGDNTSVILTPPTVALPSQKLRQTYLGRSDEDYIQYTTVPNNEYGIVDFGDVDLDEIKEKFNYPRIQSSTLPNELFAVEYAGDYHISCDLSTSSSALLGNRTGPAGLNAYIQINDDTPVAFTEINSGTDGINGGTLFRYSGTQTLSKGDFVRIYFRNETGGNYTWVWFGGVFSFLRIDADTLFDDTTCQAYPLHEAFQSVCDRILEDVDTFYSEYLGNGSTQRRTYASDGCGSHFVVTKGLHIRGYDMSEKIFSVSFNDLWDGANPILNLALQPNEVEGQEVIEILDKDSIYESGEAIYLDNVNEIERSIDTRNTFKRIEIGYQKWESEDYSGIDDPQTRHEYATPLKRIGEEITLYSKFIAASLAIENTRRKTIVQGKDYKLDNDIFIIALDTTSLYATPSVYTPDLDDDFTSITGLLNSETRYNLKLTPLRNFLRWYQYFNGVFYDLYNSSQYIFTGGEGNYTMGANLSASCNADGNYNENVQVSMSLEDGYHSNMMLKFDHPLSYSEYKQIKASRNKRIMVSDTAFNHEACRIDSIEYKITSGLATFKLWKI